MPTVLENQGIQFSRRTRSEYATSRKFVTTQGSSLAVLRRPMPNPPQFSGTVTGPADHVVLMQDGIAKETMPVSGGAFSSTEYYSVGPQYSFRFVDANGVVLDEVAVTSPVAVVWKGDPDRLGNVPA